MANEALFEPSGEPIPIADPELDVPASNEKPVVNGSKKGRTRSNRPFPGSTFQDALEFASEIHRIGSGGRVRRLTAFNELGKSPSSGLSRDLVTNANKYGLIAGNYNAEFLEPTEECRIICGEGTSSRAKVKTKAQLAIVNIACLIPCIKSMPGNRFPLAR